ncbi:hypothetical protein HanLR1_Chr00c1173g0792951 [Helianthus annuus]|nr:hypothetical protein HanLR1_Chr00c1173g0792951 [Helianthus annuus]
MLSLPSNQSANHAILTFQPTPSIQFLQQYKISDPMDAYRKICFPAVMARIREIMFFLLFVFFLNGATRGKAQLSTLRKRGPLSSPQKMPVSAVRA